MTETYDLSAPASHLPGSGAGLLAPPAPAQTHAPTRPASAGRLILTRAFAARRWIGPAMAGVEAGSLLISAGVAAAASAFLGDERLTHEAAALLGLAGGCWLGLSAWAGRYPGFGQAALDRLRRAVLAGAGTAGVVLISGSAIGLGAAAWSGLGLGAMAAAILMPRINARLRARLIARRCWGRPVVVMGVDRPAGQRVLGTLQRLPELGLVPVAGLTPADEPTPEPLQSLPALHTPNQQEKLIREAGLILKTVCDDRPLPAGRDTPSWDVIDPHLLHDEGLRLRGLRNEPPTPGRTPLKRADCRVKRAIDLALAIPCFLIAMPLILLAAVAVQIVNPGPVLYAQRRVGLGGRTIHVWKLRTMHVDAEQRLERHLAQCPHAAAEWAHHCKLADDPRIIPGVGRLLRSTSLDELPQLWNVIRGQMSLVGPRPLPPYHLQQLPQRFRTQRRSVPPGVTGMWQVIARADSDAAMLQKLDGFYLQRWSCWLDLYLLLATIPAVITRRGAY